MTSPAPAASPDVDPAGAAESGVRPLYHWCARAFVAWFAGSFAALTVATHLAQVFGAPFRSYAWTCLLIVVLGTVIAIALARRSWRVSPPAGDGPATPLAVLLVLLASAVALFTYRVDSDDYYYVPNAVHALANPSEPLGFTVYGLIPEGAGPIISYNLSTSLPFEYVSAVPAWFLGVEYLSVYYLAMPPLAAAFMAAALLFLCGQFRAEPVSIVLGSALALALWLLMGETHRAFGNLALTRAFQGKSLVLSGGIPLLAASTIEFFRRPSRGRWLLVFAAVTGMVGASTTAIVTSPLLAAILVISLALAYGGGFALVGTVALYGAAFVYHASYALAYLMTGYTTALRDSMPFVGYPTDFPGQLGMVVDLDAPFWPFLLLAGATLVIAFARGRERKLLALWLVVGVLLYLNPLTAPFWIERVTSPFLYWRVFYVLPVLPMIAIGSALAFERLGRARFAVAGLALGLAIAAHWLHPSVSVFRTASLGAPRYNLPPLILAEAREIVAAIPHGSMLAPRTLGGVIPMLSDGYPQILRRHDAEWLWLDGGRSGDVTKRRLAAARFAGGDSPDPTTFVAVVEQLRPATIVLRPAAEKNLGEEGLRTLSGLGYRVEHRGRNWLALARPGAGG